YLFFYFLTSRRRHTTSKRDWSSDVCSSDLCQHSAKCLAPVDRHFIHIGKSFIVQLYEYPLCPFIILWIRCIYLSVPVIAETEFLDLTAEIIDIHLIEFR